MSVKIAPSILSADFAELGTGVEAIATADYVHFDVMDGCFVPNISIGIPVLQSIRKRTALPIDVHLMIVQPERYVDQFCDAGADLVTCHVEADTPEKIHTIAIDPETGVTDADVAKISSALALEGAAAEDAKSLFPILYKAFNEKDMALLEINPLIVMTNGHLRVLDAKVSFDGNALFRHDDIRELRDETEEDAKEIEASKWDLAYVALDGNIGCMVNGAGLAMATMDIIKLYGKEPANFCDVGGGAGKDKVAAAFKIITADPKVEGILVNIFGGIMKCDVIAEGVVAAVQEVGLKVPLVVRLEGTNVELGKKLLNESGLAITAADDLDDAAKKIVAAING